MLNERKKERKKESKEESKQQRKVDAKFSGGDPRGPKKNGRRGRSVTSAFSRRPHWPLSRPMASLLFLICSSSSSSSSSSFFVFFFLHSATCSSRVISVTKKKTRTFNPCTGFYLVLPSLPRYSRFYRVFLGSI